MREERAIIKKLVTSLVIAIALMCAMVTPGYALNFDLSDAKIDADGGGLIVEANGSPRYFIKQDELMPGAIITKSYVIENTHEYDYDLYLRAENPLCSPSSLDLVNKICLKIYLDGKAVYDGYVGGGIDSEGRTLENDISLGTVARGATYRMTAEFSMPGEDIGNEYQGAKAEVDWVFSATRAPETPKKEEVIGPGDPAKPSKASLANKTPQTGDRIQVAILAFLICASIALLLYANKQRRASIWDE